MCREEHRLKPVCPKSNKRRGADKALIHAATGVGKTYLAAFDSLSFKGCCLLPIGRDIKTGI